MFILLICVFAVRLRRATVLFGLVAAALACQSCASPAPRPIWSVELPEDSFVRDFHADEQRVYVTSSKRDAGEGEFESRRLTAFDLATGGELWSRKIEQSKNSHWAALAGHAIYVLPTQTPLDRPAHQSVVALDGANGQEIWRVDEMQAHSNMVARGPYLFILSTTNEVLCLDGASGALLATFPAPDPGDVMAYDAAAKGRMVFSETAYHLLDPSGILRTYAVPDGTELSASQLALDSDPSAFAAGETRAYVHTIPAEWPGETSVYDIESGEMLWRAAETSGLSEEVSAATGDFAVLFRRNGDSVYNAASGELLYHVEADAHWVSTEGAGTFLALANGKLSAYDLATGKPLWESDTAGGRALDLAAQQGVAYAVSGRLNWGGSAIPTDVELFDLETGQRRWRVRQFITDSAFVGDGLLLAGGSKLSLMPLR
jgi:outer membrane protein assembly factor BamB